ncbi:MULTISPECIES: glycoside hydrolase family 13 protein [Actinoalloteichus]|uniref:Glycosidase n=1 Tax=Actinoalloteichus fjordicus TaxID=1612552 RepID=A0AAC9LG52_9PSEU|nr:MULTISPECIES: glycoside hydrolase family 13 protein [Actinoalloteichus]APU15644.1 glycosidase [Actinoalloteichus fjordicus]APU21704.1 glycosidase [Actinoalloteichus sp. GBA129-24]
MANDLAVTEPSTTPVGTRQWWHDAVVYQVYFRSFADSDGDGIGDLPGIRSRLPYLVDLGVDALWITPFYASPMADGGYDVADYRAVDPTAGTLDDAAELIREAHRLDLRVIVDIVPNHTSDAHRWFVEALAAPPNSPARARYHFRPGRGAGGEQPPNDWESVFGGPAWTRLPDGDWYLHLFAPEQPDLNWDLPEVREEFLDILRFWLDLGVDGFRVDVAHGLIKADGLPDVGHDDHVRLLGAAPLPFFDQDGVHEVYRGWREVLDSYDGPRIAVAEAWTPSAERTARYLEPDELHQAFNFHYLLAGWSAQALRTVIDDTLTSMAPLGASATWVLANHDVTRTATRLGDGPEGLRRARAAAMLMLALPGSAYVYQGEELGLPEVLDLPEESLQDPTWERSGHTDRGRDGCRVPLPWSTEGDSLGFSPADSAVSWLPQPAGWAELSVAAQETDPHSTLELYRQALRVRREHPALGAGEAVEWAAAPADVLRLLRRDAATGRAVTVVANLGDHSVRLPGLHTVLLASGRYGVDGDDLLLPPDTTVWWEC